MPLPLSILKGYRWWRGRKSLLTLLDVRVLLSHIVNTMFKMKKKQLPKDLWIISDTQTGDFVGYYVSKYRAIAEAAHYYYTKYDPFGKEPEVPSFIQVSQYSIVEPSQVI